jgi:hypothetical protein
MLTFKKLKAFVPTSNPRKAKLFYEKIVCLKLLSEDEFALEFDAGDCVLRVSIVNQLQPQPFTVLGWEVEDIRKSIDSLNEMGVFCERYPSLQQDDHGIWISPAGAKVAWFRDPDGNVLSLTEN